VGPGVTEPGADQTRDPSRVPDATSDGEARLMAMRLQLTEGSELLEAWAESASQAERNVMYEALFAVGDGSAFLIYDIFGDPRDRSNFIVAVKPHLVLKVLLRRADSSFEIRYLGAPDDDFGDPAGTTAPGREEPSSSEGA